LLESGYIVLAAIYMLLDFDGVKDAVAFDQQINFVAFLVTEEAKVHVGRDAVGIGP